MEEEKVGGGVRSGARTWQTRARVGGSPEKRESSAFQARGGGRSVEGACEGRRLLRSLTCRAKTEPQPLGRAARGFPDGTSWRARAGPGRDLHSHWGAPFAPLPGEVRAATRRAPERCCGRRNSGLRLGRPGGWRPGGGRPRPQASPTPPRPGAGLLQLQQISAHPGCSLGGQALRAEGDWSDVVTPKDESF